MTDDHDDLDLGLLDRGAVPAPLRRTPPARRRPRYRLRRAVALAALVIVGFGAWFLFELFQPFTGVGAGTVTVSIPSGATAGEIGDLLARDGVVSSSFFFRLRVRLDGDGPKLRHGVITLRRGMSYSSALAVLTTKPVVSQISITIPEGYTRRLIAARAKADGFRGSYLVASRPADAGFQPRRFGASPSVHTLEGFLFPATYFDFPHAKASNLVAQQLVAFQQNFGQLNFRHARAAGLSQYDVLIIASMIEREAQVPSDRAKVAAVIYNRLRLHMTLGIDATLRYYLGDFSQPLTSSQLALDTPYNTRLHTGLPPTAISNPGLASMIAAVQPANVSYLYYVNKPGTCGQLAFSSTYSQFLADVARYNAARNAAGGRSPTTCG
jgi:UPF0755 protein